MRKKRIILWSLLSFLMASTMCMGLLSCGDPEPDPVNIEVSPTELTLKNGNEGSSDQFLITPSSSDVKWNIMVGQSWIRCTPTSGTGTMTVVVEAAGDNPGTSPRECTLTITDADMTVMRTIKIIQPVKEITPVLDELVVTPTELSFDNNEGELELTVEAKSQSTVTKWTATIPKDVNWLKMNQTDGYSNVKYTVKVSVSANDKDTTRESEIAFDFGNKRQTVKVTQSPIVLTVNPNQYEFSEEGGKSSFAVTSNVAWEVVSDANWLIITPNKGNGNAELTLTAMANTTTERRTAKVTLTGGGLTRTINITQEKPTPKLELSLTSVDIDQDGGSQTIDVTSNIKWNATSNKDWLTVNPSEKTGNGTLTLTAKANNTTNERTASVTVTGGGLTRVAFVTQRPGSDPIVTPQSLNFNANAESKEVTISNCNVSWTISSNEPWVSVNKNSGSGNVTLVVAVSENTAIADRNASVSIRFANNATPVVVSISQMGAKEKLEISPGNCHYNKDGGSQTISITSNTEWTASSNQDWLTLSLNSGNGNASITAQAKANNETNTRQAKIIIKSKSGNITREVNVSQEPKQEEPYLIVTPREMNFGNSSSKKEASVESNLQSWNVKSSQSWCHVSLNSGSENMKFTVSVDDNPNTYQRTAEITVSGSGVTTQTISITQAGTEPYLEVSPTNIRFEEASGSQTVYVSSNVQSWSVKSSQSWCTVSRSSGSGTDSFIISVSSNSSSTERSATVTVNGGGITRTIYVTQGAGYYLEVSPSFAEFTKDGGSKSITVTSNVSSWTVTSSSNWCTVSRSSGSGTLSFTINVQSNTTTSQRTATITVKGGGITRTVNVTQQRNDNVPQEGDHPLPQHTRRK